MASKLLRALDSQGEIPLARPAQQNPVEQEVVHKQPTFSAAIRLAANCSGLEEKEIYVPLKIDASHWTRILNGAAHFPTDKLELFMDIVGNEIPLLWLAHRRGKGLVVLESESQRLLRLEQEANAKLRDENRLLREIAVGKAA